MNSDQLEQSEGGDQNRAEAEDKTTDADRAKVEDKTTDADRAKAEDKTTDETMSKEKKFVAPKWTPKRPKNYFTFLEKQLNIHKITDEPLRVSELLGSIPLDELEDSVVQKMAAVKETDAGAFQALKDILLEAAEPTNLERIKLLLAGEPRGTSKPSEYLARLQRLANGNGIESSSDFMNSYVKVLWLQGLPEPMQNTLLAIEDLNVAAKRADELISWFEMQKKSEGAAAAFLPPAPKVAAVEQAPDRIAILEGRVDKLIDLVQDIKISTAAVSYEPRGRSNYRGGNNNNNFRRRSRSNSTAQKLMADGKCYYHSKYADEAYKCVPACKLYADFQKKQADPAKNSTGRLQN
ncbi:uncharacterized protein LOC132203866 [Neocloeon triangulifer]|uniref:uncharacterized protein LOC132203866 n=1 Tax=Neocloeon triangulifer TaxID=2078957 RepID=UPI00286F7D3E|nr:uncharacterized protein LOC132203866 [Neocloeon triangulifer]